MKALVSLTVWLIGLCSLWAAEQQAALKELKVLYVGSTDQARGQDIQKFLSPQVKEIKTTSRKGFDPKSAQDFDVVLLDWSQGGDYRQEWLKPSPLGPREQWNKPTVLLGSAGLNLAVVWKIRGGSG
jgi:hypothetical protein